MVAQGDQLPHRPTPSVRWPRRGARRGPGDPRMAPPAGARSGSHRPRRRGGPRHREADHGPQVQARRGIARAAPRRGPPAPRARALAAAYAVSADVGRPARSRITAVSALLSASGCRGVAQRVRGSAVLGKARGGGMARDVARGQRARRLAAAGSESSRRGCGRWADLDPGGDRTPDGLVEGDVSGAPAIPRAGRGAPSTATACQRKPFSPTGRVGVRKCAFSSVSLRARRG